MRKRIKTIPLTTPESIVSEDERFVFYKKTALDKRTKLIWTSDANIAGNYMNWDDAVQFIKELNKKRYAGYSNWRLPTKEELRNLKKAIPGKFFYSFRIGFKNVDTGDYWSSSTYAYAANTTYVWVVNFYLGHVLANDKARKYYVWPVHDVSTNTQSGLACVRIVLSSYGFEISDFELTGALDKDLLGNTCGELVQCAAKYGFEAEELDNITPAYLNSALGEGSPIIALLDPAVLYGGIKGFGHFVVITRCDEKYIWYNDPDINTNLSRDVKEFAHAWAASFFFKGVRIWKSAHRCTQR